MIDVQRVLLDPSSHQTVYRVLQQLEADDWIRRDGHTLRPDIKANGLGDVDERQDLNRRRGFDLDAEDLLDE